jgi:uncharacterized protein involved in outer membrane biogenesis
MWPLPIAAGVAVLIGEVGELPLEVGGTFKDPQLNPQPGPLVARAALAAALFAIAPPAALLALIETGPGDDAGCRPSAA